MAKKTGLRAVQCMRAGQAMTILPTSGISAIQRREQRLRASWQEEGADTELLRTASAGTGRSSTSSPKCGGVVRHVVAALV